MPSEISRDAGAATSFRDIAAAWFPLALSFEFMVMEGPVLQGAMGRLPSPEVNLAAWGLTMGLAMLVESPVIMLLATSIALVRDQQAFRSLFGFMLRVGAVCTALAALLVFSPLLQLVGGQLMGQPANLVEASRPALIIMIPFTAAVGWRRFHQGILIRHEHGRMVTMGTVLRILGIAAVAFLLARRGTLPGVEVAAWGLMCGLFIEATVTTMFTLPIVRQRLPEHTADTAPLTQGEILKFHAPLAATTLMTLIAQPLTAAVLAHLPQPTSTLAAWPVVFMILLILRGFGITVQEATVARVKRDPESTQPLYSFALIVGILTTGMAVLLALTPLLDLYLGSVLRLPPALWSFAREGVLWGALLPVLTALGSWARGVLVAQNQTPAVYRAMLVSLAIQGLTLWFGALFHLHGMITASLSFTTAALGEYLYLRQAIQR